MAKQHRKLNMGETLRLVDWLRSDPDHTKTTSARVLAKEAATALGFDLTEHNVASLRITLGLARVRPEPKAAATGDDGTALKIGLLAAKVVALCDKLDEPVVPGLRELADGQGRLEGIDA
jgi:hypothetical protein